MKRHLVLAALLTLTPLAHAGSGNAAPRAVTPFGAPKALPANALVRPGQTWVMSGTTAAGERITRDLKLSTQAPEWDDGWDFEADNGPFSWKPEDRMILAADVRTGMMNDSDIHLCLGMIEGSSVRGVLLSGTLEELDADMDKLDSATGEPRTTDEIIQAVRKAGVNAGTCTLTLKR
ncbi:hypothetical protein [Deinococcus soli (ex Cha et al. 2016)]|uniref:Uncharacterized protein n=1 Tax=Deinococcus soli (ex Cha et al. 2016) TaxID=1309411 RepID=A0A0F7JS34_9DEIO|nr:hypothetical protein [Deinococcus soli (ex Cha et al. 2016)]AKH17553.1 hypothetical protein SY84_11460 [Deinococcus soli (ex Cha et al. 2016)]